MSEQSLLLGLLTKCRSVLKTLPNSKIELFAGLVNGFKFHLRCLTKFSIRLWTLWSKMIPWTNWYFPSFICLNDTCFLTLSCRRLLSYRTQSIDLFRKSIDWFLYDNGLRHERVKFLVNLLVGDLQFYYTFKHTFDRVPLKNTDS